jgi:hypothetical protein
MTTLHNPRISMICALSQNRVIGKGDRIPGIKARPYAFQAQDDRTYGHHGQSDIRIGYGILQAERQARA